MLVHPLNVLLNNDVAGVLTLLNKSAGIDVKPVHPLNVNPNIYVLPLTPFVLAKNNPDGIDVNPLQPLNAERNMYSPGVVIPLNRLDGILVKPDDLNAPSNMWVPPVNPLNNVAGTDVILVVPSNV